MTSLSSWAEQILLGTSITDKLLPLPAGVSDTPRAPIITPDIPGRPAAFSLADARPRAPFPGPGTLADPQQRGRVLHFFANHELLALELMALVLLRFPGTPRRFRHGIAVTMQQEQNHLRMYLTRMAALGVAPGEIPVNDFFWRALARVDSPLAFLAGMSLTFEQANLDYALQHKEAFAAVGDAETAALMEVVYQEEVSHVRHGLRWVKRWKDPQHSCWQAHCAHLPPPLTPARARGRRFYRTARQAAGLPEAYIDELEVFGHSRGRPPRVWWFNPGCELEIASGGATMPRQVRVLQDDLGALPMLLADEDDAVLLRRRPTTPHLRRLRSAGFSIPEFAVHTDASLATHPLAARTLGPLEPWGWSPAAAQLLAPLGAPPWDGQRAQWHGKSLGVAVLSSLASAPWLAGPHTFGQVARTLAEAEAILAGLAGQVVIKAELGAAGRAAVRATGALLPPQVRWLQRVLAAQGQVVIEPWLERIVDLSWHFDAAADGTIRPLGTTRFFTDRRGQYRGHWLGRLVDGLDRAVIALLYGRGKDPRRIPRLTAQIAAQLAAHLPGYVGPIGVDALIFREGGALVLKPVVEVNPRWSMGRIALALRSRVAGGCRGIFTLIGPPGQRALGLDGPAALADWAASHPVRVRASGRLEAGAWCLTDPTAASAVVAVLAVGPAAEQVLAALQLRGPERA